MKSPYGSIDFSRRISTANRSRSVLTSLYERFVPKLNLGDALELLAERGGILGEEGDDEVGGVLAEVFDERRDPVGIERFERVDHDERQRPMEVVNEVLFHAPDLLANVVEIAFGPPRLELELVGLLVVMEQIALS